MRAAGIAFFGMAAGAVVAAVVLGRRSRAATEAKVEADGHVSAADEAAAPWRGPGIAVLGGLLVTTDPTAAFNAVEATVEPLFRDGARPSADDVLVYLFSALHPHEQWPPPAGTPAAQQWGIMVERVRAILAQPPRAPQRLQVVK